MIRKGIRYLKQLRSLHRINIALSKAAATAGLRQIDATKPGSWEFSGFSQHGEDGVIDYLLAQIKTTNRYFVEIGAANGLENNTSWLAVAKHYSGLMIEGDPEESAWCRYLLMPMNYGIEFRQLFVTRESATKIADATLCPNPDVFSLDIDGNDYHVAEAILGAGIKPKIWVVEYNSAYGPSLSLTIAYKPDFRVDPKAPSNLYYGCSITAWKNLMAKNGYRFVTVESSGCNAFFVDPKEFEPEFVSNIQGVEFRENVSHKREYKTGWQEQYDAIKNLGFVEVGA